MVWFQEPGVAEAALERDVRRTLVTSRVWDEAWAAERSGEPSTPAFLTEALRVVDNDEISLELTAPNRPGLLRGGADFLYVIMPVNLQ